MLDLRIEGANKLREMALQLRKADKEYLGRQLGQAIRRAAEPALRDFRQAARNIHTTGERKPGARHPFVKVVAAKGTREKIAVSITARVLLFSENPRVQFRTGQGLPANIAMMPLICPRPDFRRLCLQPSTRRRAHCACAGIVPAFRHASRHRCAGSTRR